MKNHEIASSFYRLIPPEVRDNKNNLNDRLHKAIKEYYPNLINNYHLLNFYQYNWSRRITNIIPYIKNHDKPLNILDTACGVGTESIFFSSLNPNAKVTGVDFQDPYTELAQIRIPYYEKILGKKLNIDFTQSNIMDYKPKESLDIIWVMEAISHIYPTEGFIERMHKHLNPGGLFVISDTNLFNPVMFLRILRLRGFRSPKLHESIDNQTGKTMKVYQEKIFTISGMKKLLIKYNFDIASIQIHGFTPPIMFWLLKSIRKIDAPIGKLPLFNKLGGIYTIVAKKN